MNKDPLFNEDLEQKIRGAEEPLAPLPRNLSKRKVPTELRKGLRRSSALHGLVIALCLVNYFVKYSSESEEAKQAKLRALMAKNAIRVDIVDLPSMKLDDLSKIDLTQEVGKQMPADKAEPKPEASKTAMVDATKKPEPEKKAEKPKKEEKIPDKLKEIRERLRADLKRKEMVARLQSKGGKDGRELMRGNIVSEGYSSTGDVANDADVYNGKARAHVQHKWNVPGWMSASKLSARVLVKIAPDGRVISKQFLKKSGNDEFDGYVQRAIEDADPFPTPPDSLKRSFMEEGVEWGFPN